jgi:hypothetical protein
MNALSQFPPSPQNDAILFEESQRFTQWWIWALALIPVFAGVVAFVNIPRAHGQVDPALYAIIPVMVLVPLIFAFSELHVTITPGWLHLRYTPYFVNRRIPLAEVAQFENIRYNFWVAGYGIHYVPIRYGWVYNVRGLDGIQLRLASGKRMLIGTQRPQEFLNALAQGGAHPR